MKSKQRYFYGISYKYRSSKVYDLWEHAVYPPAYYPYENYVCIFYTIRTRCTGFCVMRPNNDFHFRRRTIRSDIYNKLRTHYSRPLSVELYVYIIMCNVVQFYVQHFDSITQPYRKKKGQDENRYTI